MSPRHTLPTAEEIGTLVSISRIAQRTPYSPDFLRQLARSGKLRAYKLNRDWLTTPAAILDYLRSQADRHTAGLEAIRQAERSLS